MRVLPLLLGALVMMVASVPAGIRPVAAQSSFDTRYDTFRQDRRRQAPPQERNIRRPQRGEVRRQPPPPQYYEQQRGFRIPFLDRLFGGGPRMNEPPPNVRRVSPGPQRQRAGAATVAKKAVEQTEFVAVLGDSFGENLFQGLGEALSDRPEVGLVRQVRQGAGLLSASGASWAHTAREVAEREKPVDAVVVMLSPRDEAPPPPKKRAEDAPPPVPAIRPWMEQYAARVDEIALIFREKGIPLIWVGLPPTANAQIGADYAFLNELVRQRVASYGGTFIDVWEGFVDEDQAFVTTGPDLDGRDVRLRSADGVHFTRAGARKLAHYVEIELRRILSPIEGEPAATPLAAEIAAAEPMIPGTSRIVLLGVPQRSPGGELVAEGQTATTPSDAVALAQPRAPSPAIVARPGRADDFAWPADPAGR